MSSEATNVENRRASDPKKPVAAASVPPARAPPAQTQAAPGDPAAAAVNGSTGPADPAAAGTKGNNSATQGLSAALAQAPEGPDAGKPGDKSNSIDRQLDDDSKKFKKECKLLLLGRLSQRRRRLTPQAPENQASRPLSSR